MNCEAKETQASGPLPGDLALCSHAYAFVKLTKVNYFNLNWLRPLSPSLQHAHCHTSLPIGGQWCGRGLVGNVVKRNLVAGGGGGPFSWGIEGSVYVLFLCIVNASSVVSSIGDSHKVLYASEGNNPDTE